LLLNKPLNGIDLSFLFSPAAHLWLVDKTVSEMSWTLVRRGIWWQQQRKVLPATSL
jgi:hypothetical protein